MLLAESLLHDCNRCGTAFDHNFVKCPVCCSGHYRRLWWFVMACCAVLGTLYVIAFWSIYALVGAVGRGLRLRRDPLHLRAIAKARGLPVGCRAASGINYMQRALRDVGRVQIDFETPPGQLGWVYELIADYGPRIVNHRGRCFTLEFQERDAANSFLRSVFGDDVRPENYAVRT
jgi:hypothetical protein